MDETLVKEIENVMKIEDDSYKKKSFIKIINYLITFKDLSFIMNSPVDKSELLQPSRPNLINELYRHDHSVNKSDQDAHNFKFTSLTQDPVVNDMVYQKGLLKKFLKIATEILPSSSLPSQLAKKLNINYKRARIVSFSTSSIKHINEENMSPEALAQSKREQGVLRINNTDLGRKYTPKIQNLTLKEYPTVKMQLESCFLENSLSYKTTISGFSYTSYNFDVKRCLEDASYIKDVIKKITEK